MYSQNLYSEDIQEISYEEALSIKKENAEKETKNIFKILGISLIIIGGINVIRVIYNVKNEM